MDKDDSFILVVSVDQFVFGLPSHEIIVAKEDVEFMPNFDNIYNGYLHIIIHQV